MEYKSWFKDLEKTSSEFNDVNNVLECFKFKYKEENHLYEWIIGISAGLFASLNIGQVWNSPQGWVRITAAILYVLILVALIVSIWLRILSSNRQKKAMGYLYREKDKQESKRKKK